MKTLLILVLFLFACNSSLKETGKSKKDSVFVHDTVPVILIKDTCAFRVDTVWLYEKVNKTDSLQTVIKALNTKLFISNYKVERVRYYLRIAIKNPSQTKFLKSWISRAIN